MEHVDLAELNDRFAIAEQLSFVAGPGELPVVEVRNTQATATIALQGGQVLAFQPHGHVPVLWLSQHSYYAAGKAIRGGIPVCWPWFGPHPTDAGLPAHGFVRTAVWDVVGSEVVAEGATQLRLALTDNQHTLSLWPHAFRLELVITVGAVLQVELAVHNPGTQVFSYGGALHSYYAVSNIGNVQILGLEERSYIDKLDPEQLKRQAGPIIIDQETDRIYVDTTDQCVVDDGGLRRSIVIAKAGSRSTVVWNPWIDKAQRMADFGDDEYRSMVCVETANAADDTVRVAPGAVHRLGTTISVMLAPDGA